MSGSAACQGVPFLTWGNETVGPVLPAGPQSCVGARV